MKLTKLFGVAALATVATFALAACGSSKSSKSSDKDGVTTVKVGVMSLSDTEEARWKEVQKNLDDAKANIKLEFTEFTDYSQPNQAVRDGDVDINAFQHYNYLENWNKENSADLVSVADTYIAPIRLYSGTKDGKNKYTDVKDIPEKGTIAVVTAGTSDIPVAEEAALTAEFFGDKVDRVYDVGVAGIHRLFGKIDRIQSADVIIVIAGMEGALASVVGGLVEVPVIAVPTSVGYGASFGGLAALLSMLNSCANGIGVVNIDNGYGAACLANKIMKR